MNIFIETITSTNPAKRNRSFFDMSRDRTAAQLQQELHELDAFRKTTPSLYDKVRSILFLYAGYRFFLMENKATPVTGKISYEGFHDLLSRRFEQAIDTFLHDLKTNGPNANLYS